MPKIDKLTPEQEACLSEFRQKYFDMAVSPERIQYKPLESAIAKAYKFIGREKPKLVVLKSPYQATMAIAVYEVISEKKSLRNKKMTQSFCKELADYLVDALNGELNGVICSKFDKKIDDKVFDTLQKFINARFEDQKDAQEAGNQIKFVLEKMGTRSLWNGNFLWGAHDLYWIAWARFAQYIGVELEKDTEERLDIMEGISTKCEWWWPYEGLCFVSERPLDTRWDGEVLHSETGPAVRYEDGYSMYVWRGVRLPDSSWIEDPDSITPETALKWENAEQRRCAMEIIGYEKLLDKLNAQLIDKDEDPTVGELYEADHEALGGKCKFLRMYCPTGRWFCEPVPPEMKTALEANAWGWDLPPEIYKPRIQA